MTNSGLFRFSCEKHCTTTEWNLQSLFCLGPGARTSLPCIYLVVLQYVLTFLLGGNHKNALAYLRLRVALRLTR